MAKIIFDNKEFRRYKNTIYYVSNDGKVYSTFCKRLLKPYIDKDGYPRIDCYYNGIQKHIKVHRMVYECWVGKIADGKQVNHYDDNKLNNHYTNLYLGTQKENIVDCIRNNHRTGGSMLLILKDKSTNEILYFQPANKFFEYCGRPQSNGNLTRVFKRNWFNENYELLYYDKGVTTRERANESLTSIVQQRLALLEAC